MNHQLLAELLGNWGEFLGSIGVLATLVYLSLQVGQAKKATRAQIVQSAIEQINQCNLQVASDPSWATIITKMEESLDGLTAAERTRYAFLALSIFNAWESLYFHHVDGYVDQRVWEKHAAALRTHAAAPGWQQWWREQPFKFSDGFTDLMEAFIKEGSGAATSWQGITGKPAGG